MACKSASQRSQGPQRRAKVPQPQHNRGLKPAEPPTAMLMPHRNPLQSLLRHRATGLLSNPAVALGEPPTGLDELDDVDPLLEDHGWGAGEGEDPGHGAVHFVGAGHFHCGGGEWRGEEQRRLGGQGNCGGDVRSGRVWKQRWRYQRAAEAEKVQGDEEEFVEGAGAEEDGLESGKSVRQ